MKIICKNLLSKIFRIGSMEPTTEDYVNMIKKKLRDTREDNVTVWIPKKYYHSIEYRLIKDLNYDLAFLCSDNKGNFKVYVSEVVEYNSIIRDIKGGKRNENKTSR